MGEIRKEPFAHLLRKKERIIRVAAQGEPADLVLKNADYLNVFTNRLCHADIAVAEGVIVGIGCYTGRQELDCTGLTVLPGFIDGHIHLESALVSPAEFARAVVPHGTTTIVADPHEIANVMGCDGIQYILEATKGLPLSVRVMLPSCVPATPLDESGAELDYAAIEPFYAHPRVQGLAEMMDFVGVVQAAHAPLEKLTAAALHQKRVDGHAPGLSDGALCAYIAAGVSSDHECTNREEALRKLELGQCIMIREGTAAHNLEALVSLLSPQYDGRCILCTDDKHPNDLLHKGHIDYILRQAVALGADPICAVKAASFHAAQHFGLEDEGAIAPGYRANLVLVEDLKEFAVQKVYRDGVLTAENGKALPFPLPEISPTLIRRSHDTFRVGALTAESFVLTEPRPLIGMLKGEIITEDLGLAHGIEPQSDILKIAVVERHHNTGHIGIGYLKGYGLKAGAVATSISHDSHNIIVVGTNEQDMADAVNRVTALRGGIVVLSGGKSLAEVPLAVAGIMSEETLEQVNDRLEAAKALAFRLGVTPGVDPFMTLSFMALPVIPALRITTQGVFDVTKQQYWKKT